jgi:serine/threonine-protein kinase RsbW
MVQTALSPKHIQLPSDLSYLPRIEGIVDNLAREYHLPEAVTANVYMALTEAVKNAIMFGNNSNHDLTVDIYIQQDEKTLSVTVDDQGKGFDFSAIPDPTAPENIQKITGRGIFFMKNLADKVEFMKNGSSVKLTFNL